MTVSGESLGYDLRDPAIRSNPYPVFARLRSEDPVHWSPALSGWLLTRYDDVRRAHVAPELGSDRITPFYNKLPATQQAVLADVVRYLNLWLVFRSPPEHSRLRKLLGAGFAMPVIQGLEPRIRQVVDLLADQLDEQLQSNRQADVIASFAMMVPAMVILDMIGAPQSMLPSLKAWSDDMLLFIGSAQGVPDKYERARSGAQNMSAYFRELIAQRRVQPCDDMISRLIAARDNDEALSEDELVASCMLMLFGGHETTTNLIGNAVHALINHPEQRAKLIARPDLIGSTIEEVLRFDGPSNSSARIVVTDHELGGKRLEAGQRVFAMINAGNRDASQFDRAECFDIERTPNRHLSFGQGIHFCMGASLARLEGRIALGTLIRRFPSLGLIDSDPPEWTNAMIMRGLRRLPVS